MAADLIEQAAEIRGVRCEHAEDGIVADRGDDCVTLFLLEEGDAHRPAAGGGPDFIGRGNDSGHSGCQTFGVEVDGRLAVDQKPVAAEHYDGFDAGPSSNGDCEVANSRHQAPVKSVANLDIAGNLVKRIRLNCHELQGIIESGAAMPLHFLHCRL